MREILKYLYEHVDQKFPGKGGIGVVGVIFLRLLSPTLVFPVKNGLIELAEGADGLHERYPTSCLRFHVSRRNA